MSSEGRLEEVIVEWSGQRFYALKEAESGLLVCPVCRKAKFASPSDLVAHLIAHARQQLDKRRQPPERPHQASSEES